MEDNVYDSDIRSPLAYEHNSFSYTNPRSRLSERCFKIAVYTENGEQSTATVFTALSTDWLLRALWSDGMRNYFLIRIKLCV